MLNCLWDTRALPFQVEVNETLEIVCTDDDMIGDELMGKFSFPILDKLQELPSDCTDATWSGDFRLFDVTLPTSPPCLWYQVCCPDVDTAAVPLLTGGDV